MNRVFVADTPYQIFNSCNIQYHCNASDRGDLFIINNFRNAEAVAKRMKEIHLFENVILADRPVNIFTCKLFIRIHAVFRLIFPQLVIHEQLKGIRRKQLIKYDIIYTSYYNELVAMLQRISKKSHFIMVEDGTGSYEGDILSHAVKSKYRFLSYIVNRFSDVITPETLLMHNPEFSDNLIRCGKGQIPQMTDDFYNLMDKVFGSSPKESYNRAIWLTDCIQDFKEMEMVSRRFADILLPYKELITVKLHPRSKKTNIYDSYVISQNEDMWELAISRIDIENKVIIALCSTGQFTPKFIYNKEPRLIFLYKLALSMYSDAMICNINKMVKKLKKIYTDKDRIMIPESEEELLICLENIMRDKHE